MSTYPHRTENCYYCEICGFQGWLEPSYPTHDALCPQCNSLLWPDEATTAQKCPSQSKRESRPVTSSDRGPDSSNHIVVVLVGLLVLGFIAKALITVCNFF